MSSFRGTGGMDRWASVHEAVVAGTHSSMGKRITTCLPEMHQWIPMLEYYRPPEIPLAYFAVKGALESCGNAQAGQTKMTDLGLFQILRQGRDEIQGFPVEQLLDPEINTIVFAQMTSSWASSLLSDHAAWFPEGAGEDLWGCLILFGGIGSGATRYLMGRIGSGGNTFGRIVTYVKGHEAWMESEEADKHWGGQSGRLVAFRVMTVIEVVKRIKQLVESGELDQYIAPFTPITELVGGVLGGKGGGRDWVRGLGIALGVVGAIGTAGLVGWTAYQGLRRRS